MQHQVTKVKFGRNTNQRKALLRSLLRELILREKIETSLEKAKWLKKEFDKVVTAAKKNKAFLVSQILNNNEASKKILLLVPKLQSRNSGYTRIHKLNKRSGDNSQISLISLILDQTSPKETPEKERSPRKRRVKKNENKTTKSK